MFDFLLTNLFSDDAFYYFKIAKNIVEGFGSTFDGINPTNGYHPLWLIVLLPIFKFFSQPLYAVLVLSGVVTIFTAIILWRILSRYTQNQWLKTFSLAIWFLNPFNIYESLNGLETALSLFFISLFILFAIRINEKRKLPNYILIGVIAGLMMLSRLDNLFFFILFLAWIFFSHQQDRIKKILLVGLIASIIVLPWLIWMAVNFGTIIPDSGASFTLVQHQLIVQDHGPALTQKIKAAVYFVYLEGQRVIQQTGIPELFWIFVGLFLGWWFFRKNFLFNKKIKEWSPIIYLFFGLAANFLLHTAVRWGARTWYFVAFNLFLVIFVSWFAEKIKTEIKNKKIIAVIVIILISLSFYVSWSRNLKDRAMLQREMFAVTQWGNENLPIGSKIGVLNAGIQGYFSKHQVVNLDGLVNNNSYKALKEKKLWDYVKKENIDYLIDFDIYLGYRYKSFWGIDDIFDKIKLIKRISLVPNQRSQAGIGVYKIIK